LFISNSQHNLFQVSTRSATTILTDGRVLQLDRDGDGVGWCICYDHFSRYAPFDSSSLFPTFNLATGTAVYYYGNTGPFGGNLSISLDGGAPEEIITLDTRVSEARQTLVYSNTGLDGTIPHTLKVVMQGGPFIDVDRMDVTQYQDVPVVDGLSAPTTSTVLPAASSSPTSATRTKTYVSHPS
jgi:hypothetical protein